MYITVHIIIYVHRYSLALMKLCEPCTCVVFFLSVIPGSMSTLNSGSNFLSQPLNVTVRLGDTYQLVLMASCTLSADFWIELGENCLLSQSNGELRCNGIQLNMTSHTMHECNGTKGIRIFETNIVVDEEFKNLFTNQNLRISFDYTDGNKSHANVRYVSDTTVPPECGTTTPTLPPTPQCDCTSDVVAGISSLQVNTNHSLRLGNMLLSTWLISFSVFVSVVLTLFL